MTTQKTGGGGVVLTSYTCDTLFCSGKEGRRSRSHRKKDEGLGDRNDQKQAGFTDSLNWCVTARATQHAAAQKPGWGRGQIRCWQTFKHRQVKEERSACWWENGRKGKKVSHTNISTDIREKHMDIFMKDATRKSGSLSLSSNHHLLNTLISSFRLQRLEIAK